MNQSAERPAQSVMKKRFPQIALAALMVFGPTLPGCFDGPGHAPSVQVFFSPAGGCTEAVVENIARARKSIFVQAYSFTSPPIAKALVDAHRRGVKVQVILDSSNETEKYSSSDFIAHAHIRCSIDSAHVIAHNKVMVIDETIVITGSFNFTKAAEEQNAENLLVIQDADLASKYLANWRAHQKHSAAYRGR